MQQPVAEALGQRRTAGQNDVAEEGLAQVHVRAVDGVHDHVMETRVLEADDFRVEEDFRCAEAFGADLDKNPSTSENAILGLLWMWMREARTLSLLPSGSVYSTSFPSARPFVASHSFSSFFGSSAM